MDFGPQPVHFRREPPTIFRKHMPWGIGTESLGMIGCIFLCAYTAGPVHFRRGPPNIFRKHIPWGIVTEKLGMIGCIFAENGPLKGGIESSFSGTGWGAKGDFRWTLFPNPCIFGGVPHQFLQANALRYRHRKFGNDRMYIRGEWALRMWHWIKFQWYRLGC